MTELEAAKLIAAGELPSPYKHNNMTLFAVRVTGTGMAYRDALDEFVWRDSSLYLNDEFLARVGGLPLIWEHPKQGSLNSKEFADRVIGACMFGYIKDEDVWAIARVYDDEAIRLMTEGQLSTSPGVVFGPKDGNVSGQNEDGETLLVEGKPSTLCHLAICAQGVWDKGHDPSGVLVDALPEPITGDLGMADEEKKADAEGRHDAIMNEKLDAFMDAFNKKFDAHCEKMDARMDAFEKKDAAKDCMDSEEEKKDATRKDKDFEKWAKEEEKEPEHKEDKKKDSDEMMDKKKDSAKKDEEEAGEDKKEEKKEEKAEKEEEGKVDARKDSAHVKELAALRAELAAVTRQVKGMTVEVDGSDRDALAAAQARADSVAAMFGDRAPPPVPGETSLAYRRRVVKRFAPHSPQFKDSRFDALDSAQMTVMEDRVYADAVNTAHAKHEATPGVLIPVVERIGGRDITRFQGDIGAFMAPFVTGATSGYIHNPAKRGF